MATVFVDRILCFWGCRKDTWKIYFENSIQIYPSCPEICIESDLEKKPYRETTEISTREGWVDLIFQNIFSANGHLIQLPNGWTATKI